MIDYEVNKKIKVANKGIQEQEGVFFVFRFIHIYELGESHWQGIH